MSAALRFTESDTLSQFRDEIRNAGLTPPEQVQADGELHRFSSNGKRGDDSGWYVLHGDGIPAGSFGDWRTGIHSTWRANVGRKLTPEETSEHRRRVAEASRKREEAERAERERAAKRAAETWEAAKPAANHPYLTAKGIKANGLKVDSNGRLLVPLRDSSAVIHSLQFIADNGDKRFLPGGRTAGLYYSIGRPAGSICIAEGFATAASIREATGQAVAVAFNAGNLEAVARALREKYPHLSLILCADDDSWTDGNPGLTKATAAARAVGGLVAVPDFGADRPDRTTDFNDLAKHRGVEAVKACIAAAKKPDPEPWADPLPLVGEWKPQPYPVDALLGGIGAAVREVASFVQCPEAQAAASALSVLSTAGQSVANVMRGPGLIGPVSLYLLTIAESGERKSECDRRFSQVLRDWEAEQTVMLEPDLAKYRAEIGAWEQEVEAVKQNIKQLRRNGESTQEALAELEQLERTKPKPVKLPRVLLESETAENLAWRLGSPEGWPSAGLLSSEAGVIFGGYAMKRDSQMQTMSLFNKLWSGEPYRVGRRTSESFELVGSRLTMGLAVQPETVQLFFDNSQGLARGTGWLARFLISCPESTQGTRFYRHPPDGWPALTLFGRRIRAMLDSHLQLTERGELDPTALTLAPDAFQEWESFYNEVEGELKAGGELAELRDVGSKASENVARIAALFHLFEYGPQGEVSREYVKSAASIVTWHLYEARRFLGGMVLPKVAANAVKLDAWLTTVCRDRSIETITTREVMRTGPNPVRHKAELEAALGELMEAGRVRLEDNRRTIRVNPALLRG